MYGIVSFLFRVTSTVLSCTIDCNPDCLSSGLCLVLGIAIKYAGPYSLKLNYIIFTNVFLILSGVTQA